MLDVLIGDSTDFFVQYGGKNHTNLTKKETDLHLDKIYDEDIGRGASVEFIDNEEAFVYVCEYTYCSQTWIVKMPELCQNSYWILQ